MEAEFEGGRIVVGVDGSAPSERALRWAAQEAHRHDTGLDVIHAWSPRQPIYPDGLIVDLAFFEEQGRAILDHAIGALEGLPESPSDVQATLVKGEPATVLANEARQARLLVVGSRGHGGFVGLLLGSVSQRCVEHAPCPVAVVSKDSAAAASGRVIVGVDGSDASYGALRWAFAEATQRAARLDVVNAYSYYDFLSSYGPAVAVDPGELEASSRRLMADMVEAMNARADDRPSAVELIPSALGAAASLLDVAEGADLLVVGSRGRGSFRGLLLGSVSRQCVYHASCPVVVVRGPDAAVPSPAAGDDAGNPAWSTNLGRAS